MTISAVNPNDEGFSLQWSSPQEALAFAAAAAGGVRAPLFVWRNGAATDAARNIFGTWAELYAATPADGTPWVLICDSSQLPCTVPAGDWSANTRNVYVWGVSDSGTPPELVLDDGALWDQLPVEIRNCRVTCGTAAGASFMPLGEDRQMLLDQGELISAVGAACEVAGLSLTICMQNRSRLDGGAAGGLLLFSAGSTFRCELASGSTWTGDNVVADDGSCTCIFESRCAEAIAALAFQLQFTGTFTTKQDARATVVLAGLLDSALGASDGFLNIATPATPITAGAAPGVPIAGTSYARRLLALTVNVSFNDMDADTVYEVYRAGAPTGLLLTFPSTITGLLTTGLQGVEIVPEGGTDIFDVRASGVYGGLGSTIQAVATLEFS